MSRLALTFPSVVVVRAALAVAAPPYADEASSSSESKPEVPAVRVATLLGMYS